MRKIVIILILLFFAERSAPNDSSASIAQGGLIFVKEPRISMESEELYVSPELVTVDYVFRNKSDKDVTSIVAFPDPGPLPLKNFSVLVDGKVTDYKTEIKAIIGIEDRTNDIKKFGLDPVESLRHFDGSWAAEDFGELDPQKREEIVNSGLFIEYIPAWKLDIKYYWNVRFPAGKKVKISHKYKPHSGQTYFTSPNSLPLSTDRLDIARLSSCLGEPGKAWLNSAITSNPNAINPEYSSGYVNVYVYFVDYILTTANNWEMPISSFKATYDTMPDGITCVEYVNKNYSGAYTERNLGKPGEKIVLDASGYAPASDIRVYFLSKTKFNLHREP